MRQVRIILLAVLMAALITATLLLVTRRNAVLISAIDSLTPRPANAPGASCEAAFSGKSLGRDINSTGPGVAVWGYTPSSRLSNCLRLRK
jgi:hypothetical protein